MGTSPPGRIYSMCQVVCLNALLSVLSLVELILIIVYNDVVCVIICGLEIN